MITFAKFQQEIFVTCIWRMINGVIPMSPPRTHPLDDNKMITK
uniref:Uncharacterized protein n=1 Tax=viral metagenome TaxID=1070528 RepID=A0A6C0M099_9ZZZZ